MTLRTIAPSVCNVKTKRITFRASAELYRYLAQMAKRDNRSLSSLVEKLLIEATRKAVSREP